MLSYVEDKNPSADLILRDLNNPFIKAYFQFMAHVLPLFNNFNKLFQSESIVINCLGEESHRFLRLICANFLHPIAFENINKINPKNPNMLLPLEKINIGFAAKTTLSSIVNQDNDILEFKLRCLKFYQVAVEETLKRLPLDDKLIAELKFLHPTVALRIQSRFNIIDKNNVLTEWEMLKYYFESSVSEQLYKKSIVEFWQELSKIRTFNNEWPFKNLCQIATIALSLPHSNAEVERVFSVCTDIKTKKRNRLNTETLCALLRIKLDLKNTQRTCRNYPITNNHYDLFRKNLYQK
ncbi:hypothetical protein ALC57_01438 [Trachymyrmex cornetzi]|uniref:HAT C-terminal dimerisation domain-containing protein n=1 Tax=Trachymyrmex cornetzi TaxID=471704 RepID=A0A151JPU9_9HYME|nr:hypothetical protein ALC57_01438 [Trachymyrmex cornetzi]